MNTATPLPASLIITAAALLMPLLAFAVIMVITSSFNALLIYIGFTLSVFAMMAVAGMMRLRKKMPGIHTGYKTIGYPLTPLIFILGNLWIILFTIKSRPANSLFGLATIGIGVLVYLYFSSPSKRRMPAGDER